MKYKRKVPVEICGYRNALIPTLDATANCIVDKWWSVCNDIYDDDDFIPWDSDEGSSIPPF